MRTHRPGGDILLGPPNSASDRQVPYALAASNPQRPRGNTEGTPAQARASIDGHSFFGESLGFQGFVVAVIRACARFPRQS